MIKDIVKDEEFLKIKSDEATPSDLKIGEDLKDTLIANSRSCVGLAANMIGVSKRIICVLIHDKIVVMYNPKIVQKDTEYEAVEGCLSLEGERKAVRYKHIVVEYYDRRWKKKSMKLSGFTAQIVQHEADHLEGIII